MQWKSIQAYVYNNTFKNELTTDQKGKLLLNTCGILFYCRNGAKSTKPAFIIEYLSARKRSAVELMMVCFWWYFDYSDPSSIKKVCQSFVGPRLIKNSGSAHD